MIKHNIIILAKCNADEDLRLYSLLYSKEHELHKKAVVYLFSDVEQFENLLVNCKKDFTFSLLVHLGATSEKTKYDGMIIIHQLKQLSFFENLNYHLTSRKGNYVEGHGDVIYTTSLLLPNFEPAKLTSNTLSTLIRVEPQKSENGAITAVQGTNSNGLSKGIDFAVLTALYEDEFQIYKEHCQLKKDPILGNCYKAVFNREISRLQNHYQHNFALIHQEQMGLVDAAIYATQIIDQLNPRFLLMGGVCGGLRGSVNLYDIIIPTVIYDYATGRLNGEDVLEVKETKGHHQEMNVMVAGDQEVISGKLEPKNYKADSEKLLTTYLERRKEDIILNMREMMPETEKKNFPANFNIHLSEFACGPWVIKTNGFMSDFLLPEFSQQIRGLEMESYSINRVGNIAQKYGKFSLVVKSVMDFTDPQKTDGPGGSTKKFAALISLVCIRALMPILLEFEDPKM